MKNVCCLFIILILFACSDNEGPGAGHYTWFDESFSFPAMDSGQIFVLDTAIENRLIKDLSNNDISEGEIIKIAPELSFLRSDEVDNWGELVKAHFDIDLEGNHGSYTTLYASDENSSLGSLGWHLSPKDTMLSVTDALRSPVHLRLSIKAKQDLSKSTPFFAGALLRVDFQR